MRGRAGGVGRHLRLSYEDEAGVSHLVWREELEYFDAFLIGLTATPNQHTYAFFDENVVSEYTHEEAVSDGVNVGALGTFSIETEKTKQGGSVPKINQQIEIRDKRTRKQRWESTDEEIAYWSCLVFLHLFHLIQKQIVHRNHRLHNV